MVKLLSFTDIGKLCSSHDYAFYCYSRKLNSREKFRIQSKIDTVSNFMENAIGPFKRLIGLVE